MPRPLTYTEGHTKHSFGEGVEVRRSPQGGASGALWAFLANGDSDAKALVTASFEVNMDASTALVSVSC
jgi:hypothetical protein